MKRKHVLQTAGLVLAGAGIGRLSGVERQVTRYRRIWEDHNIATYMWMTKMGLLDYDPDRQLTEAESKEAPFLLVALGDSSTQGIGANRISEGYVPQLANLIQQHLGKQVACFNLSLSGGTIESVMSSQVPILRGTGIMGSWAKPDLVVVNIGGNDVGEKNITGSSFRSHLNRLGGYLPPASIFGNIPSFSFLPAEKRAQEYSRYIDEMAAENGHQIADLRTLSQSYSTAEYLLRYHAADMFHPNSRAYAQWASLFFEQWLQQTEPDMVKQETGQNSGDTSGEMWKIMSHRDVAKNVKQGSDDRR